MKDFRLRMADPLSQKQLVDKWNAEHPDEIPLHYEELTVEEAIKRYGDVLTEEQKKSLELNQKYLDEVSNEELESAMSKFDDIDSLKPSVDTE